jgi:hypothetical protein
VERFCIDGARATRRNYRIEAAFENVGSIPRHILREGQLAAEDEANGDDEGARTGHTGLLMFAASRA